jgi:Cu(I)/Ag(I) efflux system membrane fusion protein
MLKPGMNAWLRLNTQSQPMLLIPSKALIDTGTEQRVITVDNDGRFVPKRIDVFQQSGGVTAVSAGLSEGEKVVSSGLFLIDSEANISGALDRMRAQTPAALPTPARTPTEEMTND